MSAAPITTTAPTTERPKGDVLGWILLALLPLGGIAQGIALGSAAAAWVDVVMIPACAIIAFIDAKRWAVRSPTIGMLLLIVIYYPVYFHRRAKHGAPRGLVHAIVAELLYVALFMLVVKLRFPGYSIFGK